MGYLPGMHFCFSEPQQLHFSLGSMSHVLSLAQCMWFQRGPLVQEIVHDPALPNTGLRVHGKKGEQ